tara:strand:+ start:1029 stop:1655 length:627 start_codon:yes stop_codon:yes gene_type:complete
MESNAKKPPTINKVITKINNDSSKKIQNPFMVKIEGVPNRLFCDERLRIANYNTSFVDVCKLDKNRVLVNNEMDDSLSYTITSKKGDFSVENERILTMADYDYDLSPEFLNKVRVESGKKPIHVEPLPLSFCNIKTIEEGIKWYATHFPLIPDDLLPIMSRYNFGNTLNKHTAKKEYKQLKQKNKKYDKGQMVNGAVFSSGKFSVKFD